MLLSGRDARFREAGDVCGVPDWIDPDTGDPAEGFLRPRLEAD